MIATDTNWLDLATDAEKAIAEEWASQARGGPQPAATAGSYYAALAWEMQYRTAVGVLVHARQSATITVTGDVNRVTTTDLDALRAKVREYEAAINWDTTCLSCAAMLDAVHAQTVRAEKAEALLAEVRKRAERAQEGAPCDPLHEFAGRLLDQIDAA